jgi:hypothetical protein
LIKSRFKSIKTLIIVTNEWEKLTPEETKLYRGGFFCGADTLAHMNHFISSHSSMLVAVGMKRYQRFQ